MVDSRRFILSPAPDELLQMEEAWVNEEVDPDEARRRAAQGEADGIPSFPSIAGRSRSAWRC